MKVSLFFTLLFIVSISALRLPRLPKAQALPPLPNTPLQYTANMKVSIYGDFPETYIGVVYYDYVNLIERSDLLSEEDHVSYINDFVNGIQYSWDSDAQDCYCESTYGAMDAMFIPYGAIFVGQGLIGTTPVTLWNFTDPRFDEDIIYQFNVDNFNTVLRLSVYEEDDGFSYYYTIDFTNITLGQPSPSAFIVPDYCKCDDPIPPPPPAADCTDPDKLEMCQCPKPSDLAFCTQVNYAVSSEIDIASIDQFVQKTYTNVLATITTNPSQTCKDNFKAYLCSFYFGVCGEEEDDDNFEYALYLPCSSMCTSCSCGDSPLPLNCTAAPAGATCTTYGTGFC